MRWWWRHKGTILDRKSPFFAKNQISLFLNSSHEIQHNRRRNSGFSKCVSWLCVTQAPPVIWSPTQLTEESWTKERENSNHQKISELKIIQMSKTLKLYSDFFFIVQNRQEALRARQIKGKIVHIRLRFANSWKESGLSRIHPSFKQSQ